MKIKRSKGEYIFAVFNYVFLVLLSATMIYPFIYTISISLSSTAEATRAGFHIFPRQISLTSYQMVFRNKDIFITYGNTIFRTVVGTVGALLVTAMYAYPLSRKYMPGRKFIMAFTIFTMLFSGGMVPTYLMIRNIHLYNNRLVLILPMLISAYNVVIMRSFFMGIPNSLMESAQIDGANEIQILFMIVMPLAKPVLATVGLWVAVSHWNSWLDSLLYLEDGHKQVVQQYLQSIIRENQSELIQQGLVNPDLMEFTPDTIKSATIVITILPILCVYPFIQKYFVKGVMLGSVKG